MRLIPRTAGQRQTKVPVNMQNRSAKASCKSPDRLFAARCIVKSAFDREILDLSPMQRMSDPQYDCVGRMSSVALLHKARAARVTVAVASLSVITLAPTPEVGAAADGV